MKIRGLQITYEELKLIRITDLEALEGEFIDYL